MEVKTGKKKKMSIHSINTEATIRRVNEKIRYVKENIRIGTQIQIKAFGGGKSDYAVLQLKRIEGKHYIFASKQGWVQAYTMNQLCFEVSKGSIKIIKEDKRNDKK